MLFGGRRVDIGRAFKFSRGWGGAVVKHLWVERRVGVTFFFDLFGDFFFGFVLGFFFLFFFFLFVSEVANYHDD